MGSLLALMEAISSLFGWHSRRKADKAAVQPIITLYGEILKVRNRSASELLIESIEAPAQLAYRNWGQNDYGEEVFPSFEDSPISPGWMVPPLETASFRLKVGGASGICVTLITNSVDPSLSDRHSVVARVR